VHVMKAYKKLRYSSIRSVLQHQMQVSGQLQAPVTSSRGKDPQNWF